MRRALPLAALYLLLLTGCSSGDKSAQADAGSADKTSNLPQLEAGQTDEDLAEDWLDSFNTWTNSGRDEVAEQWDESDGVEALWDITDAQAQEASSTYSEALLTDDFGSGEGWTLEDIEGYHASLLHAATPGSHPDGVQTAELVLDGSVTRVSDDPLILEFNYDSDVKPALERDKREHGVMTVTFEQEGDAMKVSELHEVGGPQADIPL